jgi:lipid-A-disaccharide synthase
MTARFSVFIAAGEESGDQLGAGLMAAIEARLGDVAFSGIGGARMMARGLSPLFPMTDLEVMGVVAALSRLPTLLERIRRTADTILATRPDVVVLIDAQDFSRRVAARVKAADPTIPVLLYGAPTVWFWRPKRALRLRALFDAVLALLPFEPEVMARLGGPRTLYVGHPAITRFADFAPTPQPTGEPPVLLCLPGSRRSEVTRLLPVFGVAVGMLAKDQALRVVLPTLPRLVPLIEAGVANWPLRPTIVAGDEARMVAFRQGRAALAASGTVTLELALAGIPHVAAYRVAHIESVIVRRLAKPVRVASVLLANHVLGRLAVPEFIQQDCTAPALAKALGPLFAETPDRQRQIADLAELRGLMSVGDRSPDEAAADAVLALARTSRLAAG